MLIVVILFSVILTGCTSTGWAPPQNDEQYAREGVYAQVGGGYAIENFDLPSGVDADDSLILSGRLGYRFNPNFAGEVLFEYLDEFELDVSGLGSLGDINGWALSANAKIFPLTGRVQPYGLLGFGWLDAEIDLGPLGSEDDSDTMARFGGGVDFYMTQDLFVNVEGAYVLPFGDLDDADFISFVLSVGFWF
jgi:opacity protein-like surface antigen